MRRILAALAVAAAGLGSWLALAWLEAALGGGLVLSACLEEAMKVLVLGLALVLGRSRGPGRALLLGLMAIGVFAAAENLAYLLAFRSPDILERLLWSEPVHLVTGLAWALALAGLARGQDRIPARLLGFLGLGALALSWHLGFNLLAAGPLPGPGREGHGLALALAGLCNGLAIIILGRYFVQRAIIGGFLYGED